MPIRRWDTSRPPSGPFALNRDAPQARGLVAWWPMGNRTSRGVAIDEAGTLNLSGSTNAMAIGPDGRPAQSLSSASSHSLSSSTMAVSGFPMTLAAWVRPATAHVGVIMGLGSSDGAAGNNRKVLYWNSDSTIHMRNQVSGSSADIAASGTGSAGTWLHGAAVFAGSTDYRVFRNGANKNTSSTSISWGSPVNTLIGYDNASTTYFNGDVGECGIWNATLSDDIIARLHDQATRYELWYPLRSRKWMWMPLGSGAQTVAISQVNETDTAQALTAVAGARTVAISQVASSETAQALTATSGTTVAITQAASTETAQGLTAFKTVATAITQAQESDTAQSITAATSITTAIGQVASTETAQAVTATNASTVAITQVQSTETAQALTVAATKTQAITQVASTETAQAFTAVQPGVFTAANEVDAAQALSVRAARTVALGQVSSVETAQSLTPRLTTTTGITLALEIDAAQALASIGNQSVAVTQAQETDTARALAVFFEGGALDTVALYSIVTQLVSLSSKQTRTRSGDSYIAPVVSRDSHIGD